MPIPAVSSLGGFRTPAAVRVETFVTAGVRKPSQELPSRLRRQHVRCTPESCRPDAPPGSFGPILSKKVFLVGEEKFSAPLVHPARADVRDHVESQEGDHRASYASDRGLQKRRQPKTDFREIWGAAQVLTFSTASTLSGLATPNVIAKKLRQQIQVPGFHAYAKSFRY